MDIKERMSSTIDVLKKEYGGIRTGRANSSLLDPIEVDLYGSKGSITSVANINVIDHSTLSVSVWDASSVNAVATAIRNSNLGLNPMIDGNVIKINIPPLSEERRKEYVKIASKYAENAKVSIRNIRRDEMDKIKNQEKNKEISKDEMDALSKKIQKFTDDFISEIDAILEKKESEIMKI